MAQDILHRAMALVTAHVETAKSAAPLSDGRHDVVRVHGVSGRQYAVKLYRGASRCADPEVHDSAAADENIEVVLYRRLARVAYVRPCLAGGAGFLITEYVSGRTLLDKAGSGDMDIDSAGRSIVEFVRACGQTAVTGYGPPDTRLRGTATSWSGYLREYLQIADERVSRLPPAVSGPLSVTYRALRNYFEAAETGLAAVRAALVPVDLNLANFLLTEDQRLIALDLETFWLADPLMALGELTAHTYGTPLHGAVVNAWGMVSREETRRVRFYALLATLDIELFIAESDQDTNPELVTPWGNPVPFGRLAVGHRQVLADDNGEPLAEDLLRAVPTLRPGRYAKGAGGPRTEPLADVLVRLNRIRPLAGITRVADVTGLDRTGIYVSQSIRPDAEVAAGTFTVFSGRGTTLEQSRAAAIAEGIERLCCERGRFDPTRIVTGTVGEAARENRVVGLEQFNLPADADYSPDTRLEWVSATDVPTGEEWLVPACAVFYPYTPPEDISAPLRYFTTGLGAGWTLLEAITHGLAEVAERDAAALNRILRDNPAVRLDSIQAQAARGQLEHLTSAGLDVVIRWITAPDIGIPVFSVICGDGLTDDGMYISGGYGAHPDKEIALIRAIQEAAASRAGTISGAREDLTKFRERNGDADYAALRRKYAYWFDTSSAVDYGGLPGQDLPTTLDDLVSMVSAFRDADFPRVLFVDLSRPELELRVVKVLVPGVERYSFTMRCVGERARRRYRARYGRDLPLAALHPGCG